MDIGMLWFDNDKTASLETKVKKAVEYYKKKYGQTPNVCYANPSTLSDNRIVFNGVEMKSSLSILPNHFWIGVSNGSK